jgi:hypothetical protein
MYLLLALCDAQSQRGTEFARQPCYRIPRTRDLGQWLCVPPFRMVCPFLAAFVKASTKCRSEIIWTLMLAIGVPAETVGLRTSTSCCHYLEKPTRNEMIGELSLSDFFRTKERNCSLQTTLSMIANQDWKNIGFEQLSACN